MKKNRRTGNPYWIRLPQKLIAMGLRVLLLVCVINTVSAAGFSQGKKLDVDFTNSTIGAVLDIDGLFGSGLNKPLSGGFAAVVKCTDDELEIIRQGKGWLEEV